MGCKQTWPVLPAPRRLELQQKLESSNYMRSEAVRSQNNQHAGRVEGVNTSQGTQPSLSTLERRERRILTPRQAAELLSCDEKTITRWARKGYLPAHPLGEGKKKYWRFFEDELFDWLNGQTNGALAA